MSEPTFRFRGTARLVRGGVLAGAIVLASVTAHAASAGATGTSSYLVLTPLAFVLCASVADRRRSGPWILGYCLGMQALFHVLLSFISAHHGHSSALLPSPLMVLGHACIAVGIAALLAYGDDIAHRWITFLAGLLAPLTLMATAIEWTPITAGVLTRGFCSELERRSGASRRGPPPQ